ncbi:hypothetical protein CC86DRAFT_208402 [Ophiobolus disseminans]|uniref:Uncharacterized protein n=1 Tax=Ophiobolus disseminans TaxID=1469910 RepID=A0A6A7A3A7_9PLEO|nr:hypothetical protein CC86DRAFT_208402 [Ophiobolus disseminans]
MSSCAYVWQTSTGIIIPLHKFREYEKDKNDTLSPYLSRPTLNLATIVDMINRLSSGLLHEKKELYDIRTKVNIKPRAAATYWIRSDTLLRYGPYALTYQLMSERYLAATELSSAIRKRKESTDTIAVQTEQRPKINKQVAARKRKDKQEQESDPEKVEAQRASDRKHRTTYRAKKKLERAIEA